MEEDYSMPQIPWKNWAQVSIAWVDDCPKTIELYYCHSVHSNLEAEEYSWELQ